MNTLTQLANFQDEIRKQYNGLSKRLKQVAKYMLIMATMLSLILFQLPLNELVSLLPL